MDSDYWFHYESVKPAKDEFMIGEDLKFISKSIFYKDSHVIWNDILRCKIKGDEPFSFYSEYTSENIFVEAQDPDGPIEEKPWVFQANVPKKQAVCYLTSVIKVQLPLNLTKVQIVVGPEFIITPNKNETTLPY